MGEPTKQLATRMVAYLLRPFPTWLLRVGAAVCGLALFLSTVRHFDGGAVGAFDAFLLVTWMAGLPLFATELERRKSLERE
jgi:hypothetical protein